MPNYLQMPISEFYDIENKYIYTKIKNMVAPTICNIERNLNEICYKKNGIGDEFRSSFLLISETFSPGELQDLMVLYKKIRSINVHARTFYSKEDMKYSFDLGKIKNYDFMGLNIPFCIASGELTVYGMLALIALFLNVDQLKSFLNTICNQEYFDIPAEYKVYSKKSELMERYAGINNIRDSAKDMELIFFEEQFIVPIVAESFLILEEEIFKVNPINPTKFFIPFSEAATFLNINAKLRQRLIDVRNMWAHGNCFYYTSNSDNLMVDFIEIMGDLLQTEYAEYATHTLDKIKRTVLNFKYKRPIELVLRLQMDRGDQETLLDRLGKIQRFNDKDKLVPLIVERKLAKLHLKGVVFFYRNKEIKFDDFQYRTMDIVYHISESGEPFIVEGFQTEYTTLKEYRVAQFHPLAITTKSGKEGIEKVNDGTAYVRLVTITY